MELNKFDIGKLETIRSILIREKYPRTAETLNDIIKKIKVNK